MEEAWRPVREAASLPHTDASQAVTQGETIQMAGKLLGHRRIQTTERYAHFEEGLLLSAA